MRELLESIRQNAIRQLEQEEQDRAAELRELQQTIAKLEAEQGAAVNRKLRAQKPLTDTSACPRCWIWDGVVSELKPIGHDASDRFDLFRCKCGQEVGAPID